MTTQPITPRQPIDDVYDILQTATNDNLESVVSKVVDLCSNYRKDTACAPLPANMQGALLEETRRHFFELECRVEKNKAQELINTQQTLESYFFWADYQALIESEWRLIEDYAATLGRNPHDMRFAFIGSGAMPVSPLMLAERTDHPVICVDADEEANGIAKNFLNMIGRQDKLVIHQGYAQDFDYTDIDIVFMASLINPKAEVLQHINSFNVSGILARSVCDGFCMIYEALEETLVSDAGYKIAARAAGSTDCMHNTLLLAKHIA